MKSDWEWIAGGDGLDVGVITNGETYILKEYHSERGAVTRTFRVVGPQERAAPKFNTVEFWNNITTELQRIKREKEQKV